MNVLVAVDGSKFWKRAIEWVVQLQLATPLNLRALHIIDIDTQSLRVLSPPWFQRRIRSLFKTNLNTESQRGGELLRRRRHCFLHWA